MSEQPVFVVGHKNPDADAVCSAIGYAAYKNSPESNNYVPVRCGNSNPRIDAILKRFDTPLPQFLGDVTPRVKDILKTDPHVVNCRATCSQALEIMDKYDYRALPVVDDDGCLKGLITIFGLGEYFTPKIKKPLEMRRVRTNIADIIKSLGAKAINVIDPNKESDMFIRVGAMDIRSFDRSTSDKQVPARSSIVIVGDRWDIQEKCIQIGVRLIVITGGLKVDKSILKRVKENGISMIVSPHDTATTSLIIRTAASVENLMDKVTHTFSLGDTIAQVKRRILDLNAPLFLVTDDEKKLKGVFSKTDLLRPVNTKLVLVDHNEMNQAIDGAREVQIVEIIDHHRLGSFTTEQPILFVNEPVGSTSTIVANLFRKNNVPMDPKIAGILMGGVISDTLKLMSPTTTEIDKEVLHWLSEKADCSIDEVYHLVFSSGSTISSKPAAEVIEADCKQYPHGEIVFSVSQIEELGFVPFWNCWEDLYKALENYRKKSNLFFSSLLVTDINTQNSLLLISGDQSVIESISYPLAEKKFIFELKGVVSRKKQLIPYLTSSLKNIGIESRQN